MTNADPMSILAVARERERDLHVDGIVSVQLDAVEDVVAAGPKLAVLGIAYAKQRRRIRDELLRGSIDSWIGLLIRGVREMDCARHACRIAANDRRKVLCHERHRLPD